MKIRISETLSLVVFIGSMGLLLANQWGCRTSRVAASPIADTLRTNQENAGLNVRLEFIRGKEHNHPLMAAWITDTNNKYIETIYVAESIAKGEFKHADNSSGKWMPGPLRRPAALPVWSHNRNVKEKDGLYIPTSETPMPDAVTGATPPGSFFLFSKISKNVPQNFLVWFEINQTWDWNNYWSNNKFPDDEEYKTSCQPALVYNSRVNILENQELYLLELIGHSSYNGSNGEIYSDLSTITTAKEITVSVGLRILK